MVDKDASARATTATKKPRSVPTTTGGSIGEVIEFVKDYVRQETLGPLRGAGRWLAFGALGALALAGGVVFLVLGQLRLLQHEFAPTFSGRWMTLLPYAIAMVTCLVVIALAASRIGKKSLHDDSK